MSVVGPIAAKKLQGRECSEVPIAAVSRCSNIGAETGYSFTSSAVTSSLSGIVSPSVFAVLRLITNSNLVGS